MMLSRTEMLRRSAGLRAISGRLVRDAEATKRVSLLLQEQIAWMCRHSTAPRLMRLRGASDAIQPDLLHAIKTKLLNGTLWCENPDATSFGTGDDWPCDGCDRVISEAEIEVEVEFSDLRTFRFHACCFSAWRTETQAQAKVA